jgi:hypothetical protein
MIRVGCGSMQAWLRAERRTARCLLFPVMSEPR